MLGGNRSRIEGVEIRGSIFVALHRPVLSIRERQEAEEANSPQQSECCDLAPLTGGEKKKKSFSKILNILFAPGRLKQIFGLLPMLRKIFRKLFRFDRHQKKTLNVPRFGGLGRTHRVKYDSENGRRSY